MAKNCHEWTWPQVHYFGQNLENWTDKSCQNRYKNNKHSVENFVNSEKILKQLFKNLIVANLGEIQNPGLFRDRFCFFRQSYCKKLNGFQYFFC